MNHILAFAVAAALAVSPAFADNKSDDRASGFDRSLEKRSAQGAAHQQAVEHRQQNMSREDVERGSDDLEKQTKEKSKNMKGEKTQKVKKAKKKKADAESETIAAKESKELKLKKEKSAMEREVETAIPAAPAIVAQ